MSLHCIHFKMVNFILCVLYHNKCIKRFGNWSGIKWLFREMALKSFLMSQEKVYYIQGVNFSLNVGLKLNNLGANFGDNWEATTTF